jgi:hypothetical protein
MRGDVHLMDGAPASGRGVGNGLAVMPLTGKRESGAKNRTPVRKALQWPPSTSEVDKWRVRLST